MLLMMKLYSLLSIFSLVFGAKNGIRRSANKVNCFHIIISYNILQTSVRWYYSCIIAYPTHKFEMVFTNFISY